MTSSNPSHPETLVVYGLSVAQGRIGADWVRNPSTYMDLDFPEVLAAGSPVLVVADGVAYTVSQWPVPGVATIADLKIDNEELSLLSGRVHSGHQDAAYKPLVNRRVGYIVNNVGRIIIPAESPFAAIKAA